MKKGLKCKMTKALGKITKFDRLEDNTISMISEVLKRKHAQQIISLEDKKEDVGWRK
jgi:hypothetical protein